MVTKKQVLEVFDVQAANIIAGDRPGFFSELPRGSKADQQAEAVLDMFMPQRGELDYYPSYFDMPKDEKLMAIAWAYEMVRSGVEL